MARIEVELSRTHVTVGQFLAYVRAQLRKRGLDEFTGSLDYASFIRGSGWNGKTDHKKLNDEMYTQWGIAYEEILDLPYTKKSCEIKANGKVSNEIIEFEFDSETTGRGYYYLTDDGVEDEVESVEPESESASEQEDNAVAEVADEPVAGITYAGEPVTLGSIAHEFARQPKYYDDRARRDTTDSIIEYHFQWCDGDGFEHRDWIGIPMSDACSAVGVVFDCIEDDEDLDARTLAEYIEQEYELNADGDPADVRAYKEIRRDIWQSALDECDRARDELCSHEDISEPWFRELVEEMYARVKASVEEYEI